MVEQQNSNCGTVLWNSGTVEPSWWNSVMKQWNGIGGTVWGHSGNVRWNSGTVRVEPCGGTVEQSWWNSVVEQWNSHGGTVWWNSGTLMVEQCNEIVEQ